MPLHLHLCFMVLFACASSGASAPRTAVEASPDMPCPNAVSAQWPRGLLIADSCLDEETAQLIVPDIKAGTLHWVPLEHR